MKKVRWNLQNMPEDTKQKIETLAKKEKIFANEKVAEILNDYLYDIELGQNKNYFDKRWQEVIDSFDRFADAQNKNTEAFGQSFSVLRKELNERFERLENIVFYQSEQVEILRGVQQMLIGYSPEESKQFAEAYKKYTGESLKNEMDFDDPLEKNENDWFEGEEY